MNEEMKDKVREAIRTHPLRREGLTLQRVREKVSFPKEDSMDFYDAYEEVKKEEGFRVGDGLIYVREEEG